MTRLFSMIALVSTVCFAASQALSFDVPKVAKPKTVFGRVVGHDGQPVRGAELLLIGRSEKPEKIGASDADGRFRVSLTPSQADKTMIARKEGSGFGFIHLHNAFASRDLELQLGSDRPITGTITNLDGRPVSGAKISVSNVRLYGKSLDLFYKRLRNMGIHGIPEGESSLWMQGESEIFKSTTDAQGKFTISGVGDQRFAVLKVVAEGYANDTLWCVNHETFQASQHQKKVQEYLSMFEADYREHILLTGPDVKLTCVPEMIIRGVMKDDADQPRASVDVTLHAMSEDRVKTDSNGAYEIRGVRKRQTYTISVGSDAKTGLLGGYARTTEMKEQVVTLNLTAKKGVIVTGRFIDKTARRPVLGDVQLIALKGNPIAGDSPRHYDMGAMMDSRTDADGEFRAVTGPGRILLIGSARERDRFQTAKPDPNFPDYFSSDSDGKYYFKSLSDEKEPLFGHIAKVLDIKPGTKTVEVDVEIEAVPKPGR